MSRYALGLIAALVMIRVAAGPIWSTGIVKDSAAPLDDLQPMTVRGEIWDSTCAAAGSHGKIMTSIKFH